MVCNMSREYDILKLLGQEGGLLKEEIVEKSGMSLDSAKTWLYKMRKEGLVSNRGGKRGIKIWKLTAKGRNILDLYNRKMNSIGGKR